MKHALTLPLELHLHLEVMIGPELLAELLNFPGKTAQAGPGGGVTFSRIFSAFSIVSVK